jgi:hypothetical protein
MPTPVELALQAKKAAEQLATQKNATEIVKKINADRKKIEDDKIADNRLAAIKTENRNRNLYIGGVMVVGALGGFFLAKRYKTSLTMTILATIGGSLVLGVPAILLTKKKAVARREETKLLLAKKSTVVEMPTGTLEQAIKTVENITSVIPKAAATNLAGSGVLTVEEQAKMKPAPLLPIIPAGSTNLTSFV